MRLISAGERSATQPRVKKVPFAPASAKMCSTASQFASTRHSSVGQSARSIVRSKAPTWNQSSTSTDRTFCIFPHLHQRDSRFRPDCQAAQVRDDAGLGSSEESHGGKEGGCECIYRW